VIQQPSRHTRARGDVLHEDIFIWLLREQRGSDVEQLFASLLRLQPASCHLPPPPTFSSGLPTLNPQRCQLYPPMNDSRSWTSSRGQVTGASLGPEGLGQSLNLNTDAHALSFRSHCVNYEPDQILIFTVRWTHPS
jgi:hypothetical protein